MTHSNSEEIRIQDAPEPEYRFFKKGSHIVGITLIILSGSIYAWFSNTPISDWNQDVVGFMALLIYAITMIYGLVALFTKRDLYIKAIAITLMYICCFAYNTQMHLFGSFSPLQTVLMIGTQLCLLALHVLPKLPAVGQKVLLFLSGLSMAFTLHLVIHLVPTIPIAVIGCILFGLGLLAFVPIFSLFHFIRMLRRGKEAYAQHKSWFWIGLISPVMLTIFYLWPYVTFRSKVSEVVSRYEQSDKRLSKALFIRQYIGLGRMEEEYLNASPIPSRGDFGLSFNDDSKHQPMSMYAGTLVGSLGLSEDEKSLILNGLYEHRHKNSPRAWAGNHLATKQVTTKVDVFPSHRLAYVEKVIDVAHTSSSLWPRQQEAVYTFHLPEGALGTSLSLWIDGKEEPARLSTSTKANAAYSTIVGRERRDPAIMNWKDGNRLSVNVFPVELDLPRTFKVGFTIPLHYDDGYLNLQDIYFQGPDFSSGEETVNITFHENVKLEGLVMDGNIYQEENGFRSEGNIQEHWQLSWKSPELSKKPFCFDGDCYSLATFEPSHAAFKPKKVLFDINTLWSEALFRDLNRTLKEHEKYVYDDQSRLVLLTEENTDKLFQEYQRRRFSIIPAKIFASNEQESADFLVISKAGRHFPILSDLPSFASLSISQPRIYDQVQPPFFLFELSNRPHLNTQLLQNAGIAHTHFGHLDDLKKLLAEKHFPVTESNDRSVAVRQNQTRIKKTVKSSRDESTGPDHLMRLFNYGLLMDQLQEFYFKRDEVSEDQIALARSAYIVSPFSSLVSLENSADYQRFEITEPKPSSSLFNAGSLTGGSVPEPHEWALILIAALSMSFLLYKRLF